MMEDGKPERNSLSGRQEANLSGEEITCTGVSHDVPLRLVWYIVCVRVIFLRKVKFAYLLLNWEDFLSDPKGLS